MGQIYHIAAASDWEEAKRAGEYRISTRGQALDEVGFPPPRPPQVKAQMAAAVPGMQCSWNKCDQAAVMRR